MFLESLVHDVALSRLFQWKTGVRGAILYAVRKLSSFTLKSVYVIFIAFIAIELNHPRVIIAVVHAERDARDAVEIQDWDVGSDHVDQMRPQVHHDDR